MPKRYTITEKWTDPWFRRLRPLSKVLFLYICDNCDIAGFWEIDLELAAIHIKTSGRSLEKVWPELAKAFEINGRKLWVRNFLRHQGNLPLNPENNAHKGIIRRLEENRSFSPNVENILANRELEKVSNLGLQEGAMKPPCKGKGKGIGNGKGKGKGNSKIVKDKFLDFVYLTSDEYVKLAVRYGNVGVKEKIAELNDAIGSKGYKYKSHYHTILAWERKHGRQANQTGGNQRQGAGGSGRPHKNRDFNPPTEGVRA